MIQTIRLQNIRSYSSALFELEPGVNIIVGPNASGKTNLLESAYMALQGAAFKNADSDMVMRGQDWGRIDMTMVDGVDRAVKLEGRPLRKSYVIDEVAKKRLTAPLQIPVVLFEPNHMLLLGGEPGLRRAYIDGIVGQSEPAYKKTLAEYRRSLAQRNRLLKQEYDISDQMFAWDVRLSELAGSVVEYRAEYIAFVEQILSDLYRSVSGNKEDIRMTYESKLDVTAYSAAMLQKLKSNLELDRLRGFTGCGPHRDDLSIMIDGVESRATASRGESRSIILALKMAELALVRERTGQSPVVLLDDVFSELDGKRRRLLAEALHGVQACITTTDADAIVKSFLQDYHVITTSA